MFLHIPREFPAPSLTVFFSLQALDLLTTLIGLRLGAQEGSYFVNHLMHLGTIEALLISKTFAILLGMAALRFKRPRVVVFLNYWFAVVVTWNLGMIIYSARA